MACKFMVNSAFEARLLLRPSRQRAVSFGTAYELGCPIAGQPRWPLIHSSRTYSEATPTPSRPKNSGFTKGSQSSVREDMNWSSPEVKNQIATRLKSLGGLLFIGGVGLIGYATKELWLPDWYRESRRCSHESTRESTIYNKLKKGSEFREGIKDIISREILVDVVRKLITPTAESRLYPLIIGEHGTGKTSLIKLAVDGMKEPKGVIYIDMPLRCDSEVHVAKAMQQALGWIPDQVIDSSEPASLEEVLEVFSHIAIKYEQEYKRVPVLIINNANRLAEKQQGLLDLIQDYAKRAADEGTATVVFVLSEGHIPSRMMERSSWSRSGKIIEIGDVSKEEALQYLRLRKIDGEQTAQIYELVGGRMIHLKSTADDMKDNDTLQAVRQKMFYDANKQLKTAEVLPGCRYHKEGVAIVRELLKKGSISLDAYYNLVGIKTGDKLLETNVFAFHFNSGEITFQSTAMRRYCEKELALLEGRRFGLL